MAIRSSSTERRRIVTIATASFRPQVERLVRSLRGVHPEAQIQIFVEDESAFGEGGDFAEIVPHHDIVELGVKRAKFSMYRYDGRGPFVYLDGDIVVLRPLDELFSSSGLTACADDLSGCPFIVDRTHPWPGAPTLLNRRYINSGVLGFGQDMSSWVGVMETSALDTEFWERHIHPHGLFDNHVLCALLELHDIPLTLCRPRATTGRDIDPPPVNWSQRTSTATWCTDPTASRSTSCTSWRPRHRRPSPVRAARRRGADRQREPRATHSSSAVAATRSWHARAGRPESDVAVEVMSRAFVDTLTVDGDEPTFVREPHSVVSVALSLQPSADRWNGLLCRGASLEAAEYVALRDISAATHATTVLETGGWGDDTTVPRRSCHGASASNRALDRGSIARRSRGRGTPRAVPTWCRIRSHRSQASARRRRLDRCAVRRLPDRIGSTRHGAGPDPGRDRAGTRALPRRPSRCLGPPWSRPRVATASQPPFPPIAAWSCCRGWTSPLSRSPI